MKKLLLTMMILAMAGTVWATPLDISDAIAKLPNLKQGIVYSQQLDEWLPMTSATVLKVPYTDKMLNLDVGYVGPDKVVISLSVELLKVKDWLNLDMPILDSLIISPCVYYGWEKLFNGDSDDDYGFGSSIIKFRF